MAELSGAQITIEALRKEGADLVFGYPGGANLPLFDQLYDCPVKCILVRHEQGASHMADGYARATGKAGVCIVTSGPGATNLVTGLASAYMDSVPVVAITGQVKTWLIGNDAFQEADVTGITRPITKHNFLVKDVRELALTIKKAFHIATTGRPGPVLVDLPVNVTIEKTEFVYPNGISIRGYKPTYDGHPFQIKKAVEAIRQATHPVLYVGGGVVASGASEELFKLATRLQIPVTTTLLGLGSFPETHPLSLWMLGMHGTPYANYAVQGADLLIAVGARFDDRVTGKIEKFAPKAKILHIDIDPSCISKNVKVDIPIVGDARRILQEINAELDRAPVEPRTQEWLATIAEWKEKYPLRYGSPTVNGKLRTQFVLEELHRVTKGEAIITADVGQHQMWVAQWYRYTRPRTFITSGGLGAMGFGFPAAIGAQVGRPDALVVAVVGDGAFQMTASELGTAVEYNLPVKVLIVNNRSLGMVRQWQELFYQKRYSHSWLKNPDFVKLAEAYGAVGMRIEKESQVRPMLAEAMRMPKCVVIDVPVIEEENVYPMVPAGHALDEMILDMA